MNKGQGIILDEREIIRYKKQIDEDFELFPFNKRFIQLEKSWIRNISHKLMPKENRFDHNDRKKLRIILLNYLNKKKKAFDKRGI